MIPSLLVGLLALACAWPAMVVAQIDTGAGRGAERIFYVQGDGGGGLDLMRDTPGRSRFLRPSRMVSERTASCTAA